MLRELKFDLHLLQTVERIVVLHRQIRATGMTTLRFETRMARKCWETLARRRYAWGGEPSFEWVGITIGTISSEKTLPIDS